MSEATALQNKIDFWINSFAEKCEKNPGPIEFSLSVGPTEANAHVVVCAAVHGDEVGAIPAFVEFVNKYATTQEIQKLQFTLILGDPEAAMKNVRFVESDVNRSFVSGPARSPEHLRAQNLMKVIKTADLFLDFHQTIQPTATPFYIFMPHEVSMNFARVLGASNICILDTPLPASKLSSEQYAQSLGIPGVTLELGQIGINKESTDRAFKCLLKIVEIQHLLKKPVEQALSRLALTSTPIKKLNIFESIPFRDPKDKLFDGWRNLDLVTKDTLLGKRSTGDEIKASRNGYICFPKYPKRHTDGSSMEKLPSYICELAEEEF